MHSLFLRVWHAASALHRAPRERPVAAGTGRGGGDTVHKKIKKLALSRETLTTLTLENGAMAKVVAGVSVQTCPLACTAVNHFCVST